MLRKFAVAMKYGYVDPPNLPFSDRVIKVINEHEFHFIRYLKFQISPHWEISNTYCYISHMLYKREGQAKERQIRRGLAVLYTLRKIFQFTENKRKPTRKDSIHPNYATPII